MQSLLQRRVINDLKLIFEETKKSPSNIFTFTQAPKRRVGNLHNYQLVTTKADNSKNRKQFIVARISPLRNRLSEITVTQQNVNSFLRKLYTTDVDIFRNYCFQNFRSVIE